MGDAQPRGDAPKASLLPSSPGDAQGISELSQLPGSFSRNLKVPSLCSVLCKVQSFCFPEPCPLLPGGVTASPLLSARAAQSWQDPELAALGECFPPSAGSYGDAAPVISVCDN